MGARTLPIGGQEGGRLRIGDAPLDPAIAFTAALTVLTAAFQDLQDAASLIERMGCPAPGGLAILQDANARVSELEASNERLVTENRALVEKYNTLASQWNDMQQRHRLLLHQHASYLNHFGKCEVHQ
jgi:hypothetical protein